jgi:hypothetical protein
MTPRHALSRRPNLQGVSRRPSGGNIFTGRLARILKSLGLVILPIVLVGFAINSLLETYRWDNRIVEEMKKQGFDLVSQTKGSAPILPWTLFYPYVTQVTLVHPDSIKRFKGFIGADVISFNKDERGKVESWPRIVLFDCASNLVANLADQRGRYDDRIFRPDGVQEKKWWFEMNEQMNTYFCKNIIITR